MKVYLIRRFLLLIPTLLGINIIVFTISWFVPGGPIEQQISQIRLNQQSSVAKNSSQNIVITQDQIDYLKELYGFDKPIHIAFWEWQKNALVFDFGESYRYQEPVLDLILERMPVAFYFGIVTTIITYLICIPLGVFKSLYHKTLFDNISSVIVFIGYSIPAFIFGLLLIYTLGSKLDWFPIYGLTSEDFDSLSFGDKIVDLFNHTFMPILCYLIGSFAYMTLLVKNSLLENLGAPFVRTAVAKGLSRYKVIFSYVLRNSLIPLMATFGQVIGLVFTGSFLIEKIFNIDGMGLLGYNAITERDYPVVMGSFYMTTLLFLLGNILSDVLLAKTDPRIRFV